MNQLYRFFFAPLLFISPTLISPVVAQYMPTPTPSYYVTRVKDINPYGTGVTGGTIIEFGGKAYFSANDGVYGNELWVTNGTESGTTMLKNINTQGSSTPSQFAVMNGTLYFSADNGSHGRELWKTDGTASGTQMVREINPSGDASPSSMVANGNILFFFATNGSVGKELWKTDGTAAGTRLVKDINPNGNAGDLFYPVLFNGKLYFTATDGSNNSELWVSDGTTAGTQLVKDINPSGSSSPAELTLCNGLLFFTAYDGTSGTKLWKSDGTTAGTELVKDTWNSSSYGSGLLSELTAVGNTLFFSGNSPASGQELWKSDGTAAGTVLVRNINTSGDSQPYNLTAFQNQLYFGADDGTGYAFWKSNGTYAGTLKVKSLPPNHLRAIGNWLYFNNTGPWKSDGTSAGTQPVSSSSSAYRDPQGFTGFGNMVLFYGNNETNMAANPNNYELCKIAPCYACPVGREGVGIEPAVDLAVTVLKNPTPDVVTVEIRGVNGQPLSLQLTNLLGQTIESKNIESAQPAEQHRFDVRTMPTGILLLRATSGHRSQTVRISKTD
ncbi:ELWxxDGT repeat protein [Larkinella sp. C7]|jgi:ELWxxDGT repeat protein|uniref:ELWxxDGT repeat protein n=1 Tax=Larkinella sp. C7 TaxID=2576607 RepID=UPI0011112608|nr:ELWxxDGT repeat protein [Larkinella sp. C7]